MTKEWAEKKIIKEKEILEEKLKKIRDKIEELKSLDEIDREWAYKHLYGKRDENLYYCLKDLIFLFRDFHESFEYTKLITGIDLHCDSFSDVYWPNRYVDSEPKYFEGDIIITDPCYFINNKDDWENSDCGRYMDSEDGFDMFTGYIARDTLYGDWSCTVYNTDNGNEIGTFAADRAMVGVYLLDEVLKYNPEFDYNNWTVTHIKDFQGTVQFVVVHTEGTYEHNSEYHKKGDKWEDYSVEIIGRGKNRVTGEPLNFVGRQTGL